MEGQTSHLNPSQETFPDSSPLRPYVRCDLDVPPCISSDTRLYHGQEDHRGRRGKEET